MTLKVKKLKLTSTKVRNLFLKATSYVNLSEQQGALLFHGIGDGSMIDVPCLAAEQIVSLANLKIFNRPILTFDDAYAEIDGLVESWSDLGNRIIIFAPTGLIGKTLNGKRVADWAQLISWSKLKNVEIQSHGHSHTNLTRLKPVDRIRELRISKELIESKLQFPCNEIAFPRGKFNDVVIADVIKEGYIKGWTTNRGLLGPDSSTLTLPRISVYQHSTARSVLGEFSKNSRRMDSVLKKGRTE